MRTLTISGMFGAVLVAGCGKSSKPPCEKAQYPRTEVERAVRAAIEALEKKGIEIGPSAWDDPDLFTALAQATAAELGCELSGSAEAAVLTESARRHGGSGGCATVEVSASYDDAVGYCGPRAVRGQDCIAWELRQPGQCLNRVCHSHDRCYDMTEIPVLSAGEAEINACLWSAVTARCDADFFAGFADCFSEGFFECGLSCLIVAAIASELQELSRDTGINTLCVECLASGACETGEGEAEAEAEGEGVGFTQIISAGWNYTCGIRSDNTVECWGANGDGQSSPPSGTFTQVGAGGWHTCGIRSDNTVECWGDNEVGQLSPPSGTFTYIDAGAWHTCGIRSNNTVECWGDDFSGQSSPPSGAFIQVSSGWDHTCGIRSDNTIECWGDIKDGQLSPPSGTLTQISVGLWHGCGIRSDNTVECWGPNGDGQSSPPSGTFTQVGAGGWHTCGIRSDNTVECWGANGDGQSSPPSGTFTQVGAGDEHTCGIRTDNTVECWGQDDYGQSTPP